MDEHARDPELGISIRFIRQWKIDPKPSRNPAQEKLLWLTMQARAEALELEHLFALPSPEED
jgi:hypothetical protein